MGLDPWAHDSYRSLRPAKGFAVSTAVLPSSPPALASASEKTPDGTATSTTSASEASPPSRPSVVTAWPARSHFRAKPPPIVPLPMVTIFMAPPRSPDRRCSPVRDPLRGLLTTAFWKYRSAQPSDSAGARSDNCWLPGCRPSRARSSAGHRTTAETDRSPLVSPRELQLAITTSQLLCI